MSHESVPNQEIIEVQPSFEVILARHAQYIDPKTELAMRANGMTEADIMAQVGHLTEAGKELARLGSA